MKKYYYNLTNGLHFKSHNKPMGFIRIQSTACEQKRWNFILQDLDNDFLYNLAIGNICVVCDLSERKKETRALYQGLEWIKYVLYWRWLNQYYAPKIKDYDCSDYFLKQYLQLDNRSKKKIDYFKKFVSDNGINIKTINGNLKGE